MSKMNMIANVYDLGNDLDTKLLLGGTAVFVSLQASQAPPKGFIAQRPREAVGGLFGGFNKKSPKVFVYFDQKLMDLAKTRFAFVIDSYLSWGLSQRKRKGVMVLLGGIERIDAESHLDVLVFDNGNLIDLYDRELPARKSLMFNAAVESVIGEILSKHPTASIKQAGPMDSLDLPDVEYIGNKPLKKISYRPLSKSMSSNGDYVVPTLVVLGGLLFYVAAIGSGWNRYSGALSKYEIAAADPSFKAQGGADINYLDVMTQRRFYMNAPRRQDLLPDAALNIVRGIGAVKNVQIKELKLPAPSVSPQTQYGFAVVPTGKTNNDLIQADREPDASLTISVPSTSASALDQAREVMTIIANQTGMSLRLTINGSKNEGKLRTYKIEGFIHHG